MDAHRAVAGDTGETFSAHFARWHLDPDGLAIWWGAYLGMANQILDAGPLAEAGPRIRARRAAARAAHGWIMDVYLLRRGTGAWGA